MKDGSGNAMQRAYLISTGHELLSGATVDSNASFLTARLLDMGLQVTGRSTVGDDRDALERAFAAGMATADIIISTGGLGPTFDDLTKMVACDIMDCQLELRPEEEQRLRRYFDARHRPMPEINLRQAMFPPEAAVLYNAIGTAPGIYLRKNDKILILLPGPPREMTRMFLNEVERRLQADCGLDNRPIGKRTIKIMGLGESQVEERLGNLLDVPADMAVALLAVDGEIHIKLTLTNSSKRTGHDQLGALSGSMAELLGHHVFGYDNDTLVTRTAELLLERQSTLAVAESCTGGMLGKMITDRPGSSRYFWGGVISYSDQAKQLLLDVDAAILANHGAVSAET
ncbi:MAG: CinA family nicotinamide mononucleotide deamidase-related protein, partial [Syntrophomonas sp.]|nr:CinA family nicotinamide mononucleotide deamidase-related protein [Syntrophomonas sp.]